MSKQPKVTKPATKAEADAPPARPLKPRPRLLAVLCILFAVWVGWLVYLYAAKIHPQRQGHSPATHPVQ